MKTIFVCAAVFLFSGLFFAQNVDLVPEYDFQIPLVSHGNVVQDWLKVDVDPEENWVTIWSDSTNLDSVEVKCGDGQSNWNATVLFVSGKVRVGYLVMIPADMSKTYLVFATGRTLDGVRVKTIPGRFPLMQTEMDTTGADSTGTLEWTSPRKWADPVRQELEYLTPDSTWEMTPWQPDPMDSVAAVDPGATYRLRFLQANGFRLVTETLTVPFRSIKPDTTAPDTTDAGDDDVDDGGGDDVETGIFSGRGTPDQFKLARNFPNPFNPTTTIEFYLPAQAIVTLKVYDIRGNEVASLVNEVVAAGQHSAVFDGANLSSGIYFYNLNTGSHILTAKMTLIK